VTEELPEELVKRSLLAVNRILDEIQWVPGPAFSLFHSEYLPKSLEYPSKPVKLLSKDLCYSENCGRTCLHKHVRGELGVARG
jgi:hypothetical protein